MNFSTFPQTTLQRCFRLSSSLSYIPTAFTHELKFLQPTRYEEHYEDNSSGKIFPNPLLSLKKNYHFVKRQYYTGSIWTRDFDVNLIFVVVVFIDYAPGFVEKYSLGHLIKRYIYPSQLFGNNLQETTK